LGIKQVQISAGDIALGMFVSSLDRPWAQTPFPIQGLMIRDHQEIRSLQAHCDYVYIDVTKGRGPIAGSKVVPDQNGRTKKLITGMGVSPLPKRPTVLSTKPLKVDHHVYHGSGSLKAESKRAEKVLLNLRGAFTVAVKKISKGRDFDYLELKGHVDEMVDSVIRCPDAFTWLLRLRLKDQHTHDHSLRSSLWAVQFARYIGLAKSEISALCLGTLLKDIGKLKLRNALLRKKQRTVEEEREYQKFVEYGVEMLRESKKVEPRVIAVVRYHCERLDGTGFPEGIGGEKIPLLARMAGIATSYDAASNPRESSEPVAPSKAISLIYNLRGKKFQEDLVVEFIQSVGIYPTGTVIELTTGDIGVVMEQYPESRLTPQVAIMNTSAEGARDKADSYTLINLKDEAESRKALAKVGSRKVNDVEKLAIARDLEPSGLDINLKEVSGMVIDCSYANVVSELGSSGSEKNGFFSGLRQRFQSGSRTV